MNKYDIALIGAGVSGTAIARELSRYRIKVCVLERETGADAAPVRQTTLGYTLVERGSL